MWSRDLTVLRLCHIQTVFLAFRSYTGLPGCYCLFQTELEVGPLREEVRTGGGALTGIRFSKAR